MIEITNDDIETAIKAIPLLVDSTIRDTAEEMRRLIQNIDHDPTIIDRLRPYFRVIEERDDCLRRLTKIVNEQNKTRKRGRR